METVLRKTRESTGVNCIETCVDGLGVSESTGFRSKKGVLYVYLHFKGMPKINNTENRKSNICRSCRNLYLIFCNQKFAGNVFSYNATVCPILLVKTMKGHPALLLFIFPCLHGYTNVINLLLNMTR